MNANPSFMLPNAPTLILACSASSARCWRSTTRHGEWSDFGEFEDDAAKLRERDIGADRPGRAFDSFGSGRHAMSPQTKARDTEKRRFANRVADYLNAQIAEGRAKHLVLMADPTILGMLRDELSVRARAAVVYEAAKNVSHLGSPEIREYFG